MIKKRTCRKCGNDLENFEIITAGQVVRASICKNCFTYNPGDDLKRSIDGQGFYVIERRSSIDDFMIKKVHEEERRHDARM